MGSMDRQPSEMGLVHHANVQANRGGYVVYSVFFKPCAPCLVDLNRLADSPLAAGALDQSFRAAEATGGSARSWSCSGALGCDFFLAVSTALRIVRIEPVAEVRSE